MKTETGEVRVNGITTFLPALCLFALLFAENIRYWRTDEHHSTAWDIVMVLSVSIAALITVYEAVRWRNWRIILSEDSVTIRKAFGPAVLYPRDNIQWDVMKVNNGIACVRLYDLASKKRLVRAREDWKNVRLLFSLEHFGPMISQDEIIWFNELRLKK